MSPMSEERPERLGAGMDRALAASAPALFLILWSSGFGFAKVGLDHAGPLVLLAWRYGLVVMLMLPAMLLLRPRLPRSPAAWMHLVIVGFLIQVVYFGLGYVGMNMGVTVGVAAIIASLQPITVCLVAPSITGELIGAAKWLGILLGLAGSAVVIASRSALDFEGSWALLICFGSMLAMAAATLYQKRFGTAEHPVISNLVQYSVGFVVVLPLALAFDSTPASWSPDFAIALAYLVIANSVVSISLLLFMLNRGQVSRVSSLFFLIPPMAALSGWLLLDEALSPMAWLGMAVAAAGVALVSRG